MKNILDRLYKGNKEEYYKSLEETLEAKKRKMIVTVNPETVMISKKNHNLKELLNDQDVDLVCDGIAIVKGAYLLNQHEYERITGIDICEFLLNLANLKKYSVYLFGAQEDVTKKLKQKIKEQYKNIKLLGISNGYVKDKDKVMKKIIDLQPDICLVAMGIPLQEELLYKYYKEAKKGIFVGVGGSFDVLSGVKNRAPKWIIKCNLEWLYRIIKEPVRLKRFCKYNLRFLLEVIYQRYKEIINYIVVGVMTTLISLLIYYLGVLLVFNPNNPWQLQMANIISWVVSVTFAYIANRKYVFESKNPDVLKESLTFYGSRIVTLVFDMLMMYLTVSLLGLNDKIMKLIDNLLVIVGNYIISKCLVFIKKEKK